MPQPFLGAPGREAEKLRQPPPARLAVPPPTEALLTDDASRKLAAALAEGLQSLEAPATDKPRPGDWRLVVTAQQRRGEVVPTFAVQNSKGEQEASADGKPVPAAAWAAADPQTLGRVAADGAAEVNRMLVAIQATRQRADPNSLYNRPARVYVADVTGAPGDGDAALTRQMRDQLGRLGPVVQANANGADFTVKGQVQAVPIAGKMLRVEIQWFLLDPKGDQRGDVIQLNEVPPAAVASHWGDVAVVVAQEAAGGLRDAILTQSGRR